MQVSALRRRLVVCFAASGAAALIYQVAWVRLLTLALGHTVAAASTVLAAFMGGLAVGAWAGARAAARRGPLLAIYAALELFVAAAAIVLPAILTAFDPLLVSAYADGTNPVVFATARVAISLILIGIPAAAMGATYPLVVAWLIRVDPHDVNDARATSDAAGALYAANSAGAAVGATAAGFWLIESLGVRGTTWAAVALNVGAAAVAWWLGRTVSSPSTPPSGKHSLPTGALSAKVGRRAARVPANASDAATRARAARAAGAAALSGSAALVYEVTWTRLLALTLGPTTYAFATMAAAFITGIAVGSTLGVRLARRSTAEFWLGAMLAGTAISSMLAAWFTASSLPFLIARDVATTATFGRLFIQQAFAIALVLLPASMCLGATFTLALATAAPGVDVAAKHTARVYTSNTFGAVAGALAAGFLLVPQFGLQRTFLYASIALFAAGMFVIAFASDISRRRRPVGRRMVPLVAGGVLALAAFGMREWDRDLITSGAYKYARQFAVDDLDSTLRAGRLEYYREGAAGTVSVRRLAGSRSLAIDGKVDASNGGDMLTQRLLGLLPTLLHSNPRDALVIGLGSGVTADAVLATGEVRHVDVLEISPDVVEASAFFARENHDVLHKPGVRLLVGDGRSHLRLSSRQYDVIISEPSNPWMSGVAALFTREFFQAARARLRPNGVFCQWSHTYEISERDLQSIVRTFADVFPNGTMWLAGEGDLLLIGSDTADLSQRVAAIADRSQVAAVPALLAGVGVPHGAAPFVLLSFYAGGPRELAQFGNGARIQTDDRMPLEFTAARAMYAPPPGNAARLREIGASAALPEAVAAIMRSARAEDWIARGDAALQAEAFAVAHESFRRAAAIDTQSARALRGSTDAAAGMQRVIEETAWLKALAAAEPRNAVVRVELSHAMAMLGDTEAAVAAATDAARIDPASAEPLEQIASIFADAGDAPRLTRIVDELVVRFPARQEGQYYRAAALFLAEHGADAERTLRAFLIRNPAHAKGHNLLGIMCGARGDRECARASFTRSLELNASDPSVYVNLGYLTLDGGDVISAIGFFREALAIDPVSDAAKRGIADARAASTRQP